ncbi:MAG: transcriptional regulator MntR [Alphaproteobacteria bacterium]|nr:transcriptional regulator MntR [Alphaproteobacteria bacterium]HCP00092.1 transcriptional regulator MntR [Rhodospirillaceae bacterium]
MPDHTKSAAIKVPDESEEMMDADRQAAQFERVRNAQQTEKAEDYVEMIDDLINAYGEARITDLAHRFGVSHATVNKIIKRLQRDGLVTSRPYRSIFLTEQGTSLADASRKRHQIVLNFLRAIGVSAENADLDAEGIEHYVSAETLAAFEKITSEKDG